jgi:hypothetical protein
VAQLPSAVFAHDPIVKGVVCDHVPCTPPAAENTWTYLLGSWRVAAGIAFAVPFRPVKKLHRFGLFANLNSPWSCISILAYFVAFSGEFAMTDVKFNTR